MASPSTPRPRPLTEINDQIRDVLASLPTVNCSSHILNAVKRKFKPRLSDYAIKRIIEEFIRKDPSRQNLNLSSAAPTTPAPPTAAIAATSGQAAAPSDASKRPRSDAAADDSVAAPLLTERKRRRAATAADGADLDEFGPCPTPKVRFSDIGGINAVLEEIQQLVEWPLVHPEIYDHLGVEPPRGVLLCGPSGTGKTKLASAIAGELAAFGVKFFRVSAPSLVTEMSGKSEANMRRLFDNAKRHAPSLLFFDEIDCITAKRDGAGKEMERRIVAQFLSCMDELGDIIGSSSNVIVMGATNRPEALDPSLRRAGRFDREINLGVPDEAARLHILKVVCARLRTEGSFDLQTIAHLTPGFVGADLEAISKEASTIAVKRIISRSDLAGSQVVSSICSPRSAATSPLFDDTAMQGTDEAAAGDAYAVAVADDSGLAVGDCAQVAHASGSIADNKALSHHLSQEQLEPLNISMQDFLLAIKKVQPSAKREGFATTPNVSWDEVGALEHVRRELQLAITEPIKHPQRFQRLGLQCPVGVLLYGPPGCGKTLLAKAVAHESGTNFISVKGPELLNKFVGESERAIRTLFTRARSSKPCIVFFDELDSLCPKRSGDGTNANSERVVNQLLTEMDGLDDRSGVFVIAATNRPDIIDPAMLRPGRLDKLLEVPLPNPDERVAILQKHARHMPLSNDVDIGRIARDARMQGFSGADVAGLCREAAMFCIKGNLGSDAVDSASVTMQHFDSAFSVVFPSVSKQDERRYADMKSHMRQRRANINAVDGATPSSVAAASPSAATPTAAKGL